MFFVEMKSENTCIYPLKSDWKDCSDQTLKNLRPEHLQTRLLGIDFCRGIV